VEYSFIRDVLGHIADKYSNAKIVCAEYIPTKKNNVASDFYDKCGFNPRGHGGEGISYESRIDVLFDMLGKVTVPYK
jgi:predicted enzyme involved in methoxymalonyl-ACP biosynthesis